MTAAGREVRGSYALRDVLPCAIVVLARDAHVAGARAACGDAHARRAGLCVHEPRCPRVAGGAAADGEEPLPVPLHEAKEEAGQRPIRRWGERAGPGQGEGQVKGMGTGQGEGTGTRGRGGGHGGGARAGPETGPGLPRPTAVAASNAASSMTSDSENQALAKELFRKGGGGGAVGTRPRYPIVCLRRRLLASRHCSVLTPCGPERVFVVSTEPPDDLSCLTTPAVGRPGDGLLPVPLTGGIQMHTPSPCGGLPTPALTCAHWGVHLQDHVPDRGF